MSMKKSLVASLGMSVVLGSLILACGSSSGTSTDGMGGESTGTGGASASGGASSGGSSSSGGSANSGGSSSGGTNSGTGGETSANDFNTATIDGVGTVIVNADGHTLYTFANDVKGGEGTGVSATWPAVSVASPSVGAGLNTADFGVTPKGQTTYDGLPLYTFSGDTAAGTASGASAVWPVAKPK